MKGEKRERYQDCEKTILKMPELFLHQIFEKRFYPKELYELIKRQVTQWKMYKQSRIFFKVDLHGQREHEKMISVISH